MSPRHRANAANVAFNADGPFAALTQISLAAANGDSLINPLSGSRSRLQKYGCFGSQGSFAPEVDPSYSVTTGAVATGGSFHFQVRFPSR